MHWFVKSWGVRYGSFSVCWLDLWEGKWGLEVAWGSRALIDWGF